MGIRRKSGVSDWHRHFSAVARRLVIACVVGVGMAHAFLVHAQIVPDGGMVTINGTSTNIVGNLVVGTNGFWTNGLYTSLTITNKGAVTNTGNGTIGLNAPAAFNQIIVTGTNSVWSNGGNANIGSSGDLNRLIVSAGGRVEDDFGNIGLNTGSRDNAVVVSGAGSIWANNNTVNVGNVGASNQLVVSAGGKVTSSSGRLGNGSDGTNNLVLLSDSGSTWTIQNDLNVGYNGSYNVMIISNAAKVANSVGAIGLNGNSDYNFTLISGAGALWTNSSDLYVGKFGSGNDLFLLNGGTAVSRSVTIGENGSDNRVIVGESLWTNSSIVVGDQGSDNHLEVFGNGMVVSPNLYLGLSPSSSNNTVLVGDENCLFIEPGPHEVYLPHGPGTVFITNSSGTGFADVRNGTLKINDGLFQTDFLNLTNGSAGGLYFSGGRLVVRGGMVSNTWFSVGVSTYGPSFCMHQPIFAVRSNLAFTVTGDFVLGSNLPNSQLYITNGGTLKVFADSSVGATSVSTNNRALVANPNSVWTNGGTVSIGDSSSLNQLVVSNGGKLLDSAGYIGFETSGKTNQALVTDSNSLWRSSGTLYAGANGAYNTLIVANGGRVESGGSFVGHDANAGYNLALVTGAGSLWTNSLSVAVGFEGSRNQLVISNGGYAASAANGTVGQSVANAQGNNPFANFNAVIVTGTGSRWTNAGDLYIGRGGSFNQFVVTNGGAAANGGEVYLGFLDSGTNNFLIVSGSNSIFAGSTGHSLRIGEQSSLNQLMVTGGGVVAGTAAILGVNYGSSDNLAVVEGAGSLWTNSGTLTIGSNGAANQTTVSNGGFLITGDATIGFTTDSDDNLALVTGANSRWSSLGPITVGYGGSFNELDVESAGTVSSPALFLGVTAASTFNLVALSGGSLYVTNSSGTGTLDVRRGTLALNIGLLETDSLLLTNGAQSVLNLNEGTLRTRNIVCSNGATFVVGGTGANKAGTLELLGGTHSFGQGLAINRSGTLKGSGTIVGNVTLDRGTLSPGASIGKLTILGSLTCSTSTSTTNFFELNRTLGTNDTIAGLTSVSYGGRLVVTNVSGNLGSGDAFQLFSAATYSGSFSSISPPDPGPGLRWVTSHLLIDGTLRVAAITNSLVISSSFLANGTNFVINARGGPPNIPVYLYSVTNVLATNWMLVATRAFNGFGGATFTNAIAPGERERYFRLQMDCATFDCY